MSKPATKPNWMAGVADPTKIVEPSSGKKLAGWGVKEKPPREYFNWFWQLISEWIDFIDELSTSERIHDKPPQLQMVGGDDTKWLLTQTPINDASVDVFVDGRLTSDWVRDVRLITLDESLAGRGIEVKYNVGTSVGYPVLEPFYYKLTAADIVNKYFVLPSTPTQPTKVIFDAPAGAPQWYTLDFVVIGDHLDWNGLRLDGVLAADMEVRVLITS